MLEAAAHQHWPSAPAWAVDAGILGKTLILLALAFFLTSILGWALPKRTRLMEVAAKWGFVLGGVMLFGAFICLGTLFANDQFEYTYVFSHGDAETAMKYKIAGIWSGQQGSFLLWACTSSIFGIFAARKAGIYRRWFTVAYATFLGMLCGILAYETPFEMARLHGQALLPPQGAGLTASLQNYWVTIHPPTIFMGFGSLTVAFAFGLAAMFTRNVVDWVPLVRPWVILSTAILGLGLCMGGFWAYETLGWGGFWMWDPVENVSFVPWIFSATLLHGLIVQVARKRWYSGNLAMAGLPFVTFCYGTFLTRSGFLGDASVHSFAEMNRVALWILAVFVVLGTLGYYGVYAFLGARLAKMVSGPDDAPARGVNREGLYLSGVLLLSGLSAAVAIGMSVPFFMSLANQKPKAVEEWLYHRVVVWFFVPVLIMMGLAPFVSWRKMGWLQLLNRVLNVIFLTIGLLGCVLIAIKFAPGAIAIDQSQRIPFPLKLWAPLVPWMLVLISVCLFCLVANVWRIVETVRRAPFSVGGFIAHIGVATLMAGLIISRGFEHRERVDLQEGDVASALGYTITFRGMSNQEEQGVFQRDNKALFEMDSKDGGFTARPGLYYEISSDEQLKPIVWPHVEHMPTYDIYFSLNPPVLDVDDPQSIPAGGTSELAKGEIKIKYNGVKREGQPGKVGTKFIANLDIAVTGADGVVRTHHAEPSMEITPNGIAKNQAPVDDQLAVTMEGMNVGQGSAMIQMHFTRAIYPIDLYYKPMTILVWLGAGVTALGGVLAALYRRPAKTAPEREDVAA
ncbi:MAG TPA: cytochrome c biogenesis protein CcsA [Fimbriimonadaceae bacterium]|nr:cytochrome c biogenesis protein CcsA [Fimbriimonadaceae bacterium]